MKTLFLLVAFGLASIPAAAQAQVLTATPEQPAAPDTAAALHRLFAAKRRVFRYVVGGTAAGVATAAAILLLHPPDDDPGGNRGGSGYGNLAVPYGDGNKYNTAALGVGITSLPVLLVEVVCCMGWGHKSEQQALADFEQHQLPRHIRHKLKAKYFQ